MKTNYSILSLTGVSFKKAFFTVAVAVLGFTSVQATTNDPVKDPTVTSLGVVSGEMIFNLKYDNSDAENLEVVLTDKEGNRLFRQVFTDKNFNKTFKVPVDVESVVVRFTNMKTKNEQKFEVSTRQRTVQEVLVTSVK